MRFVKEGSAMRKLTQFVRGHPLIVAATSLFFLLAIGAFVVSGLLLRAAVRKADAAGTRPLATPKVTGKTDALQVEIWEPRPTGNGVWHVVMRNVSAKPINEYVIVAGGQWVATELSIGNRVIWPGAEEDHEFFIPPDASPDLTIRAVMFTDGTGDGDATEVAQAQHERSELKLQLGRGLVALNRVLDATDKSYADSAMALDDLESEFRALSIRPQTRPSQGIVHGPGLYHGQQDLLNELQWLRNRQIQSPNQRKYLIELRVRIGRRTSNL